MTAVIALTKRGALLAARIKSVLPGADLYLPSRLLTEHPEAKGITGEFSLFIGSIWSCYGRFVFIMAAGIVVRAIAPLLQGKARDPAVVVLDEKGQYAVSLLSGHLGGANDLAREIAHGIGAVPVITTATDVRGIPALDDLARKNGCHLENLQDWKKLATSILEDKAVGLYSTVRLELDFPACVYRINSPAETGRYHGIIYITEEVFQLRKKTAFPYVILRPRNIILGVGCKRGKTGAEIVEAIKEALEGLRISVHSIAHLATLELKKDEAGLVEATQELGVPLKWVTAGEIAAVEHQFAQSRIVREKVGVGAVAAPAAWLTAGEPHLVADKATIRPGITVAVVKDLGVVVS